MALRDRRCVPCEGGATKLERAQIDALLSELVGWRVEDDRLRKTRTMKDFPQAVLYVNAIGWIAEQENHHPDVAIAGWNKVELTIFTHTLGGLSENDFVLAAKIDSLG